MVRLTLTRVAAYSLVAVCILHLILLLEDIMLEMPGWANGLLWTTQHLAPFSLQPKETATAGAAFWATVGSSMVPLMILAGLILRMDRDRIPVPLFVPVALLIWSLAGSLIMQPSGFPLLALVALLLLIGARAGSSQQK